MTTTELTMGELLAEYPWARRALFQRFHIGGCASCGFSETETLSEVCSRNGEISPDDVLSAVREAHAADEALMFDPVALKESAAAHQIIDIRTREEFNAVHIPGSLHFDQALMGHIMTDWPKDRSIVVVDHDGHRSLDAAAYLLGHGFTEVHCLRGGIDAYSQFADTSLPRYTLE